MIYTIVSYLFAEVPPAVVMIVTTNPEELSESRIVWLAWFAFDEFLVNV